MSKRFEVDPKLLRHASRTLGRWSNLRWLIGGSCTGKSTVSRRISAESGIEVLAMDDLIYGDFMASYTAVRYPAASYWFGADNPLDLALGLTWDDFDTLNRASNAEFLDLLARRLAGRPAGETLLIEGGFTHPSVLTQVAPAEDIVCLAVGDEIGAHIWENDEHRSAMKRSVCELPDGETKWRKFLFFDKMISETIVAESEAAGIRIIARTPDDSIAKTVQQVLLALDYGVLE